LQKLTNVIDMLENENSKLINNIKEYENELRICKKNSEQLFKEHEFK